MAQWSEIQDSIVTKLQTIASVKNVKKNWQRTTDEQAFDDAFTVALDNDATQRRVHTWIVSYAGATPITAGMDLTTYKVQYRFEVHGYINFTQEFDSEHILRDIVDDIIAAFVPYKSMGLDASATTPVIGSDINVDQFDIDEFGPVLCSHVKLTINVTAWKAGITYT